MKNTELEIQDAVTRFRSKAEAARFLGIDASTLKYHMKRLGISETRSIADVEQAIKAAIAAVPDSMAEAARYCGMNYNTFKHHACKLGLWNPNPSNRDYVPKPVWVQAELKAHLVKNSLTTNTGDLKRKLLANGLIENLCSECKRLPEWQSKPLSLQLDHIDGDRTNNELPNLRMLCPNCHSQTHTFAGRNKANSRSNGLEKVSENTLIKGIKEGFNNRQILLRSGLVANGSNYYRLQKLRNLLAGMGESVDPVVPNTTA
jgi:hypothetical protein